MDNTVPNLFQHFSRIQERLSKQARNPELIASERIKYLKFSNHFGNLAEQQLEIQLQSVE